MATEKPFGFVFFMTLLSQGLSAGCPDNWTDTGSGCMNVFIDPNPFGSTLNARRLCQQNGADLASIPGLSDEQFISSLIINSSTPDLAPDYVYIGMSDVVSPGVFAWFDNTSATYHNLSVESTDQHFIPGDRRCVAIFSPDRMWSSNITWQLVPCCFDIYSISAAVCSQPYDATPSTSVTQDELQVYCVGGCPSGWHKLYSTCYMVTDLTLIVNNTLDARSQCLAKGADLPNIRNQTVDVHLSYVMREVANRENASCVSVYQGLNDIVNPSAYVFLDRTTSTYYRWAPNEPSHNVTSDNKTEACLTATWTRGMDNETVWKDVSCCTSASIYWLACEKPENSAIFITMADDVFAVQCHPDEDECLSNPCLNSGTCFSAFLYYNCTCLQGYTGVNCETEIDYCKSSPCLHDGTCVRHVGYHTCNCQSGTTGYNCETVTDPCYSSPCYNNGTCAFVSGTDFTCSCIAGFTGPRCETNINECASVNCLNGGTCLDSINSYSCQCAPSFTGNLCQTEVTCEILPEELNNSTRWNVSDWNWGFGNIVTYCCDDPHNKFPDMNVCQTVICTSTGWNASIGDCEPHCDVLPSVENAMIGNGNSAVGNTVNFTCFTGFIFSNNETSVNTTCLADGNWTEDLTGAACDLVRCPVLPLWPYQTLDTTNNTYNTTVTFWCDVGYVLFDNTTARTIKCLSDGTWTADLPPCNPVLCPQITLQPHVNRNTSDNTYLTYANYWCDNGLRMLDGSTYRIILCDAGAEWSDSISDCSADRCFPLPYVANATPSATDANYWNQSILTCIKGHRFMMDGSEFPYKIMTCQTNGWWYPILTACQPVNCPPVPKALNIKPNTESTLFETVVTYTCITGHYINAATFYNQLDITCQDNKTWNGTIPDCSPIVCPAPLIVTNGTQDPNPPNPIYATVINYFCNPGYKFIDGRPQKSLHCNATGQWNETDVSCRKERCDPVNITAHATPDTTNTSWLTVVTYRCNEGHEWPNNVTTYSITCNPGGEWTPTFTDKNDCQPKICPPVVQMPNATTNVTSDQPIYNTIVSYDCDIGFKYFDNSTSKSRRCAASAQWEPAIFPQCLIINCPTLTDVENATRDSNDTYYNKLITYSCLPGYQFPDKTKQKPVICTDNETWTSFPAPCEVVFCPPLPYWTSAIFNTTDNNFLSTVSYTCADGSAFQNYKSKPGNQTVLTSTCLSTKQWSPPISDCVALSAINSDLVGKAYESPQGVPIGTVACTILCIILALVILLDLSKIISDLKMLRDNIKASIDHRKRNKIGSEASM